MRRIRHLVRPALLAFILTFGVPLVWILADGLNEDAMPDSGASDLGVILGGKVYPSGQPSDYLMARLDHGARLWREGRVHKLIVSGGLGKEGHDEARVMQQYLIAEGIPADRIVVDSQGVNTRATARFTAELLQREGGASAMVISQYFHITRSKLAFRQAGIAEVQGSAPWYFQWRDVFSVPREVVGLWAYGLRLR